MIGGIFKAAIFKTKFAIFAGKFLLPAAVFFGLGFTVSHKYYPSTVVNNCDKYEPKTVKVPAAKEVLDVQSELATVTKERDDALAILAKLRQENRDAKPTKIYAKPSCKEECDKVAAACNSISDDSWLRINDGIEASNY